MISKTMRATTIAVLAATAFVAPASIAYAVWTSPADGTVTITTAAPPPAQPSAPVLACDSQSTSGAYTLKWNAVAGATYNIYRSTTTNTDASYGTTVTGTSSLTYAANVNGNSTHYYRVRAIANGGTSPYSNTIQLTRGNGPSVSCQAVTP